MNYDNAESVPESPEVNKRCLKGAADVMSERGHNIDDIALSAGLSSDGDVDHQLGEVTGELKDKGENETVSETFPTTTPTTVDSKKQKEDISQPILPTIRVNTDATNSAVTVLADSSKPNTSTLQNNEDNESLSHLTDDPSCSADDKTEAVSSPQEVLGAAAREPSIQLTSTSSDSAVDTSTNSSSTSAECSEKLEQKAVDMTYSKNWLGQFKKDYFHHGKFNLDIQVFHLARLAEFYMANYRRTNNWTDCVRAHALYNSISCRKPEFLGWKKHAFSVQQEYFGDSSSFTFEQQQKLTASLKNELEAIRNESREKMKAAHALANEYESGNKLVDNSETLFSKMKAISIECSDCMAGFSSRIIRESVEILKPAEPPCDFEAVALGSLARGEATPYSDLEYLFLVEDKSPDTVEYFESLAVTTYFQIANLGETKLGYMAIKELDGWFEDKAMNGFKIDGLSDKAGNIPTGNGSPGQRNHFIVTPEELGAKYQDVLDNPQKKTALIGDITSMLAYLRPIYSRSTNKKDLLRKLQERIQSCSKTRMRQDINIEMLNTDIRKFNFVPNQELRDKGYGADVKREMYRFPSILLLDIAIVTDTAASNSWESLKMLWNEKHISNQLKSVLELLLASAAYMRLSAYHFHDSQDDRMSVSPVISQSLQTTDPQSSKSKQRWFVPQGLFIAMCVKLILLKKHLAKTENMANSLQSLALDDDDTWPRITALYYSGMHREALVVLKQLYGDCLCDDPLSAIQKILPGQSEYDILSYTSEILCWCDEYRAALSLYKHMTYNDISDKSNRIADCYRALGDYDKAMRVLDSITNKSASVYYSLGHTYYRRQKEYKKSENAYLQALEGWYAKISSERQYDYYGDVIETDEPTDSQKVSFTTISSPEERLSRVIKSSPYVIQCVVSLGGVYNDLGQYTLAESYYKKSLYLISELYGERAAVPDTAVALNNLGNNYKAMGQNSEAQDSYIQALVIYRELSRGADSSDIARTLNNLGNSYSDMGQYNEAEDSYKQALAAYRNLSPGGDNKNIANTLNDLGVNCRAMGQYSEAVDSYKQALASYRNLSQGADSCDIAQKLNSLGFTYYTMGQHSKAEDSCKKALAIYGNLSQGTDSSDIASTLNSLGVNYRKMGRHSEAVDSYKQVLAIKRKLSQGADSSDIADTLNDLGVNYRAMGQYSEAEDSYKQALAIYRKLSQGADSSDIARTLHNLGLNYSEMQHHSEAVDSYIQALAIYRNLSQGADSSDIARTLYNLGINYSEMRHHSEAVDSYKQALAIKRKLSQGADSSDIADTLNDLGVNYRAMGQYSEAEDSYKQALAIYRKLSHGADSSDIARTLNNLGNNYSEMRHHSDAADSYKQALAIYKKLSQGADSSDIADTLNDLGVNYRAMGQYSEAEDSYKQALAIYRKLSQGSDSSDIACTLNNLGINYSEMGRHSEAVDSYKQALAIKRKLSQGADSSDIADTLNDLGVNYRAMGQYSEAEDSYKQALAIYRKLSHGADSSDIARTLNNLGNNYSEMRHHSDAADSYKQALAIYRNLSQGADSRDIADSLCNLGHIYRAAGDVDKSIETLKQALDMYLRVDPNSHNVRGIRSYLLKATNRCLVSSARKLCRQGETRHHKEKYTQAEQCYKKALEVYRAISCGADSSSIALTMCNLACVYQDTGDNDKAVETLREALDMYIRVDPDNKQISRIRLYLTFYTGSSGVTDSLTTESTSNSDTQISTSVTPTSSDTNMQSSRYHS